MKFIRKDVVTPTKYLNLNCSTYEEPFSGKTLNWVWVERPGSQNAVVIAALHKNKLVVIQEFRIPISDYEWGLPAGLIDFGETPEETVRRELTEETGLKVKRFIRPITSLIYNSSGLTNEGCHLAFVEAEGTPSRDLLDGSEDIYTYLLPQNKVRELIQDPQKKFGAKAYLIFERFATYGDI